MKRLVDRVRLPFPQVGTSRQILPWARLRIPSRSTHLSVEAIPGGKLDMPRLDTPRGPARGPARANMQSLSSALKLVLTYIQMIVNNITYYSRPSTIAARRGPGGAVRSARRGRSSRHGRGGCTRTALTTTAAAAAAAADG